MVVKLVPSSFIEQAQSPQKKRYAPIPMVQIPFRLPLIFCCNLLQVMNLQFQNPNYAGADPEHYEKSDEVPSKGEDIIALDMSSSDTPDAHYAKAMKSFSPGEGEGDTRNLVQEDN